MSTLDSSSKLVSIDNYDWIKNKQALLDMVTNILTVPKRSLIFNRQFCLDLEKYLFRNFGTVTASILENDIRVSLQRYIKDINIEDVQVTPDDYNRVYKLELSITHPIIEGSLKINRVYTSYV